MSDLFSPLRDAEQLPAPPAGDVRRRGDALRRRHQALQAGGVAALVAVVALGAGAVAGGFADRSAEAPVAPPATAEPTSAPTPASPTPTDDPSTPPPSTEQPPAAPAVTTIPAGLDLAPEWEDRDGPTDEEQLAKGPRVSFLSDVVECDTSHSPADESTDHLAARYSQPEYLQGRDLRVFADDATAQRVAADYVSWFRDCPTFTLDGGASSTRNIVKPLDLGDRAWQVNQWYYMQEQPTLGENTLLVVRIGNAVLVSQVYGEGPGSFDPEASQKNADDHARAIEPLVDRLTCTFGDAADC